MKPVAQCRRFAWLLIFLLLPCRSSHAHDLLIVWNDLLLAAVRSANVPPPLAVRDMAVVHLALFDSANAAGPFRSEEPKPSQPFSREAALTEAAYRSLVTLFPKSLETASSHHRAILSAIPDSPAKTHGITWGKRVAAAHLRLRQFDGGGTGTAWLSNSAPGFWKRTLPDYTRPMLPHWGKVQPFAIPSVAAFRPGAPLELASDEWAAQFNLVKEIGATNSARRTPQQREIALFWADGPNTETPAGHWNRIAQQFVLSKESDLRQSARLFAALNVALADAAIVCWSAKFTYSFWRPITAIREGHADGNPATQADPSWIPLIPTPPFPEHTSGHSTFSGAAAEILTRFSGSDDFQFVLTSDTLPGVVRRYRKFSQAAQEAGISRIYGGIHFPSANLEGLACGKKIGEYVAGRFLPPTQGASP